MKKDIETVADIKALIDHFYDRVVTDPMIGYFFTETFKVNWAKHLPVMYSFWENTLFYTGNYGGNPMMIHRRIHELAHLTEEKFDRWVTLFCSSVDELFEGEKAELAKQRAESIATIMKIKILA
jgi:hemoglobin